MSGKVQKYGIVENIDLDQLDESPFQIRMSYGDIEGLAKDIKKHGLLQPILVRPVNGRYEIIHGHRRYRAVKSLDQKYIFGIIRELDDEASLLIHGAENIQRKNLTPVEEGRLYQQYMTLMKKTVKETAYDFEVHPSTVTFKLSMLDLPQDIQDKVHDGTISYSKARQLAILTREPDTTAVVSGRTNKGRISSGGTKSAIRTERFFPEIRQIAEDPSLKTEREIAETAKKVREGATVHEAVTLVKQETGRERIEKGGRSIEEIVEQLNHRKFDVDELTDSRKKNFRDLIQDLIKRGWLVCPDCGEKKLVWECCGRTLE